MAYPSGPSESESPWSGGPLCGLRPQFVGTPAQSPFEQHTQSPMPNQSFITLDIPAPLRDDTQTNPWTQPQVTTPFQFVPPPMPFTQHFQQGSNLVPEQQQQFFYQGPQQQQPCLLEQSYGVHVSGNWPNENMTSQGGQYPLYFDITQPQPTQRERNQYGFNLRKHKRKPRQRKPRRRHERRMTKFSKSEHQKPVLRDRQNYSMNEAQKSNIPDEPVVSQDESKSSQIEDSEDGESCHGANGSDGAAHEGSERIDSQQLKCVPAVFGFVCRACDVFLSDSLTRREHIESESHMQKFSVFTGQEHLNDSVLETTPTPVVANLENDDESSLDDLDDRLEIVSVGEQEESLDTSS